MSDSLWFKRRVLGGAIMASAILWWVVFGAAQALIALVSHLAGRA